jgi:hypothetical protein
MFYEEEQLSKKLMCPKCSQRFDEPRMLPCANLICQRCISVIKDSIILNSNKFTCPLCNDHHDFPRNSLFPVCKQIKDLLLQEPKEVYRGVQTEALKSNLSEIRTKISDLDSDIKESAEKMKIHCQSLREEVKLTTDNALNYIQELNRKMIKEIDDYELELTKPFSLNKNSETELVSFISDLKSFYHQWDK